MIVGRNAEQGVLTEALRCVPEKGGQLVLVRGEAGIGKSTFIEHFLAQVPAELDVAMSWCDPLNTPRPLGPIRELATTFGIETDTLLTEGDMFEGFVSEVQAARRPLVLVIEDLHWADQKSLDWLIFVGRRLSQLPILLIGSYRDDEVGPAHPLHRALATIPAARKTNLDLPVLSLDAVCELDHQKKYVPEELHQITGGHPFFVAEMLSSEGGLNDLPHSVSDVINARVSLLPEDLQRFLELLSCAPGEIYRPVVQALQIKNLGPLSDAASAHHILVPAGPHFKFRHELMRLAIYARMGPTRKCDSHALFLAAHLQQPDVASQLDTIVFHAEGAQDSSAILTYAPRAADRAASLGAHREAALFLGTALNFLDAATPQEAAEITEQWAYEAGLSLGIDDDVIAARKRAIDLWETLERPDRVGENLRWLSRLHWYRGEAEQAEAYILQAISILDGEEPSRETGKAYALRAQFFMLQENMDEAVQWAVQALRIAEEKEDFETQAHALNTMGSAKLFRGDLSGEPDLRRSLTIAHKHALHEQAARVYTNLSECLIELRQLEQAETLLEEGIAFDTGHDLDAWTYYLIGRKAQLRLEQDRYNEAVLIAQAVLNQPNQTLLMQMPARIILARASVRLGLATAPDALREALAHADQIGEAQYQVTLLVAHIEHAVLQGDPALAREALDRLASMALSVFSPSKSGEYQFWASLAGETCAQLDIPEPYALFMDGAYDAAAVAFEGLGANYMAAWARVAEEAGLEMGKSAPNFQNLATRQLIRDRFEQSETAGSARGRYGPAKTHPYELTAKEQGVLALLIDGKSNALIADELSRSQRTIENHVSSILSKLNCKNRLEVVLRVKSEPWILPEN